MRRPCFLPILCLLLLAACQLLPAAPPATPMPSVTLPSGMPPTADDPGDGRSVDVILVEVALSVTPNQAGINRGDVETTPIRLNHCGSLTFDSRQLTVAGDLPPRTTTAVLIARYRGVSFSDGGDNVRERWYGTTDTDPLTISLALDQDTPLYTVDPDGGYALQLWQGELQAGNRVEVSYWRPAREGGRPFNMTETHAIQIIRQVPLTTTTLYPCE